MLTVFNAMTLGRPYPLTELAPLLREAGFEGLELSIEQADALLKEQGREVLESTLRGLRPVNFGLPVEWRESERGFEKDLSALKDYADLASSLGIRQCCTWVPPQSSALGEAYASVASERLARCAEILDQFGTSLALEFLAPRHLVTKPEWVWFDDLAGAIRAGTDLADRTGAARNWGLVLDAMHLHISGLVDDGLTSVPVERIHNVQLCDAPLDDSGRPIPPAKLRNNDSRLPATTGVIDAAKIVRALAGLGYDGPISVEVFDSAQRTRDARQVVRDAHRQLTAVIDAAGAS